MLRHKVSHKADVPIFFDPSGKRWRRTWITACLTITGALGIAAWIAVQAAAPLWHVQQNQAPTYPEQLSTQVSNSTPTIGEGDLTRVDLVTRKGRRAYLTDPFSSKTLRQATPAEAKLIGSYTAVLEHYGYLPSKTIALTFDDGPSALYTSQILAILEKYHVPATFFVIGDNVLTNPSLVTREISDGDFVGGHTLTHVHFDEHGSVRNREEMIGTDRIIRDAAGYNTRIWRIPYNDETTPIGILTAQQLGYQEVDFDLDTHDWQYNSTKPIPVPKLDGNGHVVIMHDGGPQRQQTIKLLPKLIQEAKAQHYTFVTVSALLPQAYKPKLAAASMIDKFSSFTLWFTTLGSHEIISSVMYLGLILTALLAVVYVALALIKHRHSRKRAWSTDRPLPPVTVLIPAHNEEKVLRATLEKLRNSIYPEFEVIVVVNGSSDNTGGVARAFAAEWQRLRVIDSPPGKANALNMGIEAAHYDIIVTMDADTQFLPATLGNLTRHFVDPRVGGVAGHIKVGNLKGIIPRLQAAEYLQGITIMRLSEGVVVAPGACAAFRKRALHDAGGITHDTYTEDFDITLRVRRHGWHVVQDNEAVAYTEAPETLRDLITQRKRWMYGALQAFWKHRDVLLRPHHGWFSMYVLPWHLLSMAVSLVLVPLMYIGAGLSITSGQWRSLAIFSIFAVAINFVPTLAAVGMAKERFTHLLVVPLASFVMSPLRTYVLYATLIRAIKGQITSTVWTSPQRNDSITAIT